MQQVNSLYLKLTQLLTVSVKKKPTFLNGI